MSVEKIMDAIIIHGPGRSGTTLLYNILALHPELAWISSYVNRFPQLPILSILNRIQDIKWIERWNRGKRRWPQPAEAYFLWDEFFPDFSNPKKRTNRHHTFDCTDQCIQTINYIIQISGKKRFVTKITGGSRWQELSSVFDNPYLIYINRDPRAVVSSYYKQRWGYKDKPALFASMDSHDLLYEYIKHYRYCIAEMEALKRFPFKYVRYEDLVDNPIETLEDITNFVKLDWNRPFQEIVESFDIQKNTNMRWRRLVSEDVACFLESHLEDLIAAFGYL